MAFTLAKKSNQSYKDAFRAITADYPATARRYYLEDISKKHSLNKRLNGGRICPRYFKI